MNVDKDRDTNFTECIEKERERERSHKFNKPIYNVVQTLLSSIVFLVIFSNKIINIKSVSSVSSVVAMFSL